MKIKLRTKKTFLWSLFIGILAHLFTLTNVLQNYDNMCVLPGGYGTGITSGRWFLTILGNFAGKYWGNYNLPFFNGLFTIILLSVTVCIIVELFDIQNKGCFLAWGGIS